MNITVNMHKSIRFFLSWDLNNYLFLIVLEKKIENRLTYLCFT